MDEKSLQKQIEKWVVNDYFTPNIKAEVILDTLLTDYVAGIVESRLEGLPPDTLKLLTKEMPISKVGDSSNRGKKIDYVLENKSGFVYLVELKTSKGSIDPVQISSYTNNCGGKKFGAAIGDKLLSIMGTEFKPEKEWTTDNLLTEFQNVVGTGKKGEYEGLAKSYLKRTGGASTRKYLYTVGQLLDRCDNLDALWNRKLRLIYLTPKGESVLPQKPRKMDQAEWNDLEAKWQALYALPNGKSISLWDAVPWLREERKGDEYAQFLAGILTKIFEEV